MMVARHCFHARAAASVGHTTACERHAVSSRKPHSGCTPAQSTLQISVTDEAVVVVVAVDATAGVDAEAARAAGVGVGGAGDSRSSDEPQPANRSAAPQPLKTVAATPPPPSPLAFAGDSLSPRVGLELCRWLSSSPL